MRYTIIRRALRGEENIIMAEPTAAFIIYETRDYEMFGFHPGNRNVSPAKVEDLLRSFNERHYPVPVIVDQQMRILDGQHKFEAARAGGFPVNFLKLPEDIDPTQVIRQLNADQRAYDLPDHLKLYVQDGRKEYIKFQDLYNHYDEMLDEEGIPGGSGSHRIVFTSMLGLLCGRDAVEGKAILGHSTNPWNRGSQPNKLTQLFRNGEMKLNPSRGIITLDYLLKLLSVLPRRLVKSSSRLRRHSYVHFRTREYLCSLHYLLHYRNEHVDNKNEVFDPTVFVAQAKCYPKKCERPSDQPLREWPDALSHIEKIYNHQRGSRKYTHLASL
jgi:hypothetical protein